jgi:hypothetical protein
VSLPLGYQNREEKDDDDGIALKGMYPSNDLVNDSVNV